MDNTYLSIIKSDIKRPLFYNDKCDTNDYLLAAACGAIAGLVDIFLVGSPKDSILRPWTDSQVNKSVMSFSKLCGWKPRTGNENNLQSAIGFLEQKFKVNYDQKNSSDVSGLFNMAPKNHHMKSLAHSPDIIGLFFSILNQFTSTSTFISDGKIITIKTETMELHGNNLISKLFCGIVNWIGHIMSDIAGSSGSNLRGSGVVIPFYELFGLCEFGSFSVGEDKNTLAKLATKAFQDGYDARFGLTLAIPVILCDLSIKFIWSIKHYFYLKRPINECIPTKFHDDLRVMLLVGNGVLCSMDGVDALIRCKGSALEFFLRLNLIAWYRLIQLSLREICIRLNISFPLQKELDIYIRVNEAVRLYLIEIEKLDIKRYKEETVIYNDFMEKLSEVKSDNDLRTILIQEYEVLGIKLPYKKGEFDDFMKDKNKVLEFE